ncbi:endonuclease/exonuclease/phosphatase family protein [Canibacter sp. lx-72]|uniref:exodeoxyribonuclease III n=1 Tax=Canibacter zhuwentaonis TaxID=2837491 RepID=UPI001BDC9F82|nr:exodeoxyribonuclease III [Canibacter zhuwentaonis]MBT1018141.1 endonuclease/exonuclease/phosphatase family protein [Canibacter zhuwentaonis]
MSEQFRLASVNVNGVRAAYRKGMADWLSECGADVVALQEVRATTEQLIELVDPCWHIEHDEAAAKGRAGVALLSKTKPVVVRRGVGGEAAASSGRWLEADYQIGGKTVTVVSVYMHSGEVDTPRQEQKWVMLDAMTERLTELYSKTDYVAIVGDLNVGHRELDIKNWRGNRKKSGFLPAERSYFDAFFGAKDESITCVDGSVRTGLGYTDVGRKYAGEVEGPYTWWSNRGQAFDNDTGWRIDYHVATPALAAVVANYSVARYPSYDARWSDHAPVVADYKI